MIESDIKETLENESEEETPAAEKTEPAAETENTESEKAPNAGETDRENGEYHYKNGYTQKIYSDAHYVPADAAAAPPKYYMPPEKPVKEPKKAKEPKQKGSGFFVKAMCLCLVCAILGGIGGAALMSKLGNTRMDELENKIERMNEEKSAVVVPAVGTYSSGDTEGVTKVAVSAADIYARACEQVVGISTDVTYTNFFGMSSSSAVTGSGFIISDDGYIITNYHVIEYAYEGNYNVGVILHDGTRYEAKIVGVEKCNDIAVLKIDADGLKPVSIGDSDSLKVGDTVYAVGNPLGELEFSMTTGHVSALDRLINTEKDTDAINMFQMDAAVNAGNSGGPVYDVNGEVVGIVTAKYSSTGVEGLGFAIPVNDVVKIANDLMTEGYVTGKAYMGIYLDNRYNSMYSQYYGMPNGAYVSSVLPGSCSEKAGLQPGDIITKLGDIEVASYEELVDAVKQFSAGDTVQIELYRADKSMTFTITFDEVKPNAPSTDEAPELPDIHENNDEYEQPEPSELPDEFSSWFNQLFPFGW